MSLGNPTYTLMTLTKEEILDNHRSIYVSLEFQPKMKNWIYHSSTGFLNYISIPTHNVILLDLPYAPRVGVTPMWILRKSKDLLEYIQGPSPHAIALKHLTSLPSTQLFLHSKLNNK